jgi:hypothetical protein
MAEETPKSFGDFLPKGKGTEPKEQTQTTETIVETPVAAPVVPTETSKETPKETPATTPVVTPETKPTETRPETMVPVTALQAERRKRQDIEQRLAQYETPSDPEPIETNQIDPRITAVSTEMARMAHPDYDAVYSVFDEEATKNPQLYEMALNAKLPGEAAYQIGQHFSVVRQYGTADPVQLVKKIREKVTEELRSTIRAELEKELTEKIQAKANTPTNILAARTAAANNRPSPRPLTFAEELERRNRRK